jgi:uncharacterized membrane protein YfcA
LYATLMLVLAVIMVRHHAPADRGARAAEASAGAADTRPMMSITDRRGVVYEYRRPRHGKGAAATGIGAFLTGMLGVGIGEVIVPQLVKRNGVPVPVAAATSVLIVIVTVAAASFTQISGLVAAGGINAVPWNLVVYTVPGVIIGGQIGPRLQGRVPPHIMERAIGILFAVIGFVMFWLVAGEIGLI